MVNSDTHAGACDVSPDAIEPFAEAHDVDDVRQRTHDDDLGSFESLGSAASGEPFCEIRGWTT
jgi:hypothetical protein